jgi:hypothetical protein
MITITYLYVIIYFITEYYRIVYKGKDLIQGTSAFMTKPGVLVGPNADLKLYGTKAAYKGF